MYFTRANQKFTAVALGLFDRESLEIQDESMLAGYRHRRRLPRANTQKYFREDPLQPGTVSTRQLPRRRCEFGVQRAHHRMKGKSSGSVLFEVPASILLVYSSHLRPRGAPQLRLYDSMRTISVIRVLSVYAANVETTELLPKICQFHHCRQSGSYHIFGSLRY